MPFAHGSPAVPSSLRPLIHRLSSYFFFFSLIGGLRNTGWKPRASRRILRRAAHKSHSHLTHFGQSNQRRPKYTQHISRHSVWHVLYCDLDEHMFFDWPSALSVRCPSRRKDISARAPVQCCGALSFGDVCSTSAVSPSCLRIFVQLLRSVFCDARIIRLAIATICTTQAYTDIPENVELIHQLLY